MASSNCGYGGVASFNGGWTPSAHSHTAQQVGALPVGGGTVSGNLQVDGDIIADGKITTTNNYFTAYGTIVNSDVGAVHGAGVACVHVIPGGIVQVNFNAKITTAGTRNDVFSHGVNIDLLRGINPRIPAITPIMGGVLTIYNPDGGYNAELNGYGGTMESLGQFWLPARVYTNTGDVGGWQDSFFSVGMIHRGTCYGRLI